MKKPEGRTPGVSAEVAMGPNWKRLWKEVGVFAVCVGLYLSVLWLVALVIFWFIEPKMSPAPILDGWLWVFAFPARVGYHLDPGGPFSWVLIGLDPFVYGGSFWLAWRMFRLIRPKPSKDESPPSDRE